MQVKAKLIERKYLLVFVFVTSLFFLWGVAITIGDVLNRHFQSVLHISKSSSGLVQLSIFGAYAVMGIPAGLFMKRFGYKRGVQLGLFLYAVGAFLFVPAANQQSFTYFRFALFVLACGLATLETVAHPFIAALGDQRTSDQRINFAQSFNGLGGVIAPLLGSYFLLRTGHEGAGELTAVKNLYIGIGLLISFVGIAFSFIRVPALSNPHVVVTDSYATVGAVTADKKLFQHRHFVFAVIAQFFNTAAQGGTWAYFINYGHEVMQLTDERAAHFFSLSIFMMMVGRFFGTFLMRYIAPSRLLAIFAFGNILMCALVAQKLGMVSFGALIMINFFFSIMFPTIFSLGLKNLGTYTEQGSSFIVMGVVGGAIFPILMGQIANNDVAKSYYLPIICYVVILLFGLSFKKDNKGELKPLVSEQELT
ncbi:sugar MFS transporter [Mucilaginibacter lacusdianchii]|uniref:sugar MFS transporter n=1 Tax=Mucilaginibacter lacusdianchii TaxID=2684211 RepID=UPI00131EABD2|nr:sugar MFS transporter [Mucilaginibacter sp. JXJ CY 39]